MWLDFAVRRTRRLLFLEGVCQDLQLQHKSINPSCCCCCWQQLGRPNILQELALSLFLTQTQTHTHNYASLILYQHSVFRCDSALISSLAVRIHGRLNCCGKHYTNYWCQYGVMRRQAESIVANLLHSEVALLWLSLIGRQCFMAGSGFSEACRCRRMWITAQCSSTVLSWWLHLFWQALDCVWWWETAPGWHSAPALQLTMWIMATRRSTSIHQQTLRSH